MKFSTVLVHFIIWCIATACVTSSPNEPGSAKIENFTISTIHFSEDSSVTIIGTSKWLFDCTRVIGDTIMPCTQTGLDFQISVDDEFRAVHVSNFYEGYWIHTRCSSVDDVFDCRRFAVDKNRPLPPRFQITKTDYVEISALNVDVFFSGKYESASKGVAYNTATSQLTFFSTFESANHLARSKCNIYPSDPFSQKSLYGLPLRNLYIQALDIGVQINCLEDWCYVWKSPEFKKEIQRYSPHIFLLFYKNYSNIYTAAVNLNSVTTYPHGSLCLVYSTLAEYILALGPSNAGLKSPKMNFGAIDMRKKNMPDESRV